ncbi:hypothetical protein SteCoe_8805 [Stentor coeruleus]|uniref:Uncharacterized protein n=1 Tax=Stentor coeruleus TaxID=5963 RepID=A0A1R2CJ71_9CILI|nr:hypothetical protein SteCoe_8805 [Stentor coeruleus]
MSSRKAAMTNSKPPSLYNDVFFEDPSLKAELEEQRKIRESVDSIYFSDFSLKEQDTPTEANTPHLVVLNAIKDLKKSIDMLSDRVEKQNATISKIITSEEVHERISKKFMEVKILEKKKNRSEDSNCMIF